MNRVEAEACSAGGSAASTSDVAPVAGSTRALLWLVAGLGVVQCLALAWWLKLELLPDTPSSGAWTALAGDVARGIFYRPLAADGFYGGTRYMPLFFSLHGAAIAGGLGAIAAGRWLMAMSALVFLSGIHRALRSSGVGRELALAVTLLATSTVAFQLVIASVRGDLLAAGLGLWGWALAVHSGTGSAPRRRLWLAALLLGAAFFTKFTSGFGLIAALFTLWRTGNRVRARELLIAVAAFVAAGAAATWFASSGRVVAVFAACSGGGGDPGYAVRAPLHFAVQIVRDPVFASWLAVAGYGCVACYRQRRRMPVALGLSLAAAATALVVFASRGTDGTHHLLELQGATFVLIGATVLRARAVNWLLGGVAGAMTLSLFGTLPSAQDFFTAAGATSPALRQRLQEIRARDPGPILSDQPLWPIVMNERPVVADAFNLALMLRREPALKHRFREELRRGRFAAVVLTDGAEDYAELALRAGPDIRAAEAVRPAPFYPEFFQDLAAGYRVETREPRWMIWVRIDADRN